MFLIFLCSFFFEIFLGCLESSNAAIRTQTVKTLGILRRFFGPDLSGFLGRKLASWFVFFVSVLFFIFLCMFFCSNFETADVKPALLSQIEEEFDQAAKEGVPQPNRRVRIVR
jgi:hypothetical protein